MLTSRLTLPGRAAKPSPGSLRKVQAHQRLLGVGIVLLALFPGPICRGDSDLVYFVSQSGDYIGGGQTYATSDPSAFTVSSSSYLITVSAFGFDFRFAGPNGTELNVGSYPDSARWPFNGSSPGLDISGNGRGCNTECGSFEIKELVRDQTGQVSRLWVLFTNSCECFMASMSGDIRYRSESAPTNPVPRTLTVPGEFTSIQAALDAASLLTIDTVVVSNGIYKENLDFKGKQVVLTSLNGPQVTIIDGNRAGPVVSFNRGERTNSVIRGFTIQNGYASWGAGITLGGASPTIVGNIFLNNDQGGGGFGAGIGGNSASPIIVGNLFQDNAADDQHLSGVVSFVNYSSPVVANNVFFRNRCRAVNFTLPEGSAPVLVNNTIVSNTVGVRIDARVPTAAHLYRNNVLVGNTIGVQADFAYGTYPQWENNLVFGGRTLYSGLPDQTGTNGNLSVDPWFVCLPNGDFHLLPNSPGIDAGRASSQLPNSDYDGAPRVVAGQGTVPIVDLGAFEFNPAAPRSPCLYLVPPSNMVAVAAAGKDSTHVLYPLPSATAGGVLTCDPPSGSVFRAGTNIVKCTLVYGTNTLGATFTVTVLVIPYITNQPSVITAIANSNVVLSVGALGTAPLEYQWSFNNTPIPGATGSSLLVSNVQAFNQGYYRVTLRNAVGTDVSSPILLRVLPAPASIVSGPAPTTVEAGANVIFDVAAVGSAPLWIQWFKDGRTLTGATSARLFIPNVQAYDVGSYAVAVSNSLGSALSAPATLTVLPSLPRFVVQPASRSAVAGTGISLGSHAIGTDTTNDPIRYAWYFQNQPLPGETNEALGLSALTQTNEGDYFVVAANSLGKATSGVAHLTINVPPTLASGLSNAIVLSGNTLTLRVDATGTSPLDYAWFCNGAVLSTGAASLTLTNLQPMQSGYYQVTVSNRFGTISSTARISVFGPPGRVVAWGDNSQQQAEPPNALSDVVAVAGGDFHSLALRQDGSLLAWGYGGEGQTGIPTNANRYVAIACGGNHNLAITDDGTIAAWGESDKGQAEVPLDLFQPVSVAAGQSHSLALLASGRVAAWGDNAFGQGELPASLKPDRVWRSGTWVTIDPPRVCAIAAGRNHNLAVLEGGTVVGWGDNSFGQATPPANLGQVIAVAAGRLHSVALCSNGTVVVWGDTTYEQAAQPADLTNVVAIAAGDLHTLALLRTRNVVAWGNNSFGQTTMPPQVATASALAAGYYHSLALVASSPALQSRLIPEGLVFEWSEPRVLQWAPAASGPFSDVPTLGTSYTNRDMSAPSMFFRLR